MRLIGTLAKEKEAYTFFTFLKSKGIENIVESKLAPESNDPIFEIWIVDEDHFPEASSYFETFQKDPRAPQFTTLTPPPPVPKKAADEEPKDQSAPRITPKRLLAHYPITKWIIALCILLFLWNGMQFVQLGKQSKLLQRLGFTPLATALFYDYPVAQEELANFLVKYQINDEKQLENLPPDQKVIFNKIERLPFWLGFYEMLLHPSKTEEELASPLFHKIRQGEIWRVITPCVMHGGILHLLFNMLWLWLLGKMVEQRINLVRYLALMVIVGVISNTAQYLASGPFFLGYSGIVAGLAGFIWMRQKIAPWEGYPLHKGTLLFLVIFVLGMLALQVVSFILIKWDIAKFPINVTQIANTAHIVGAIVGIIIGRISFLARGVR